MQTKSTADLVKEAFAEARELVKVEVKRAKDEVREQLEQAKAAAIVLALGALLALVGLTLFAVAIPLAFGATALAAILTGVCFVGGAGMLALIGWWLLPKKPLPETRKNAEHDIGALEEAL